MAARIARAEEWIEGHERRCEERQTAMGREIRDMKNDVRGLIKGAWGVVLAIAAWGAEQIYQDLKNPEPAIIAATPPHVP